MKKNLENIQIVIGIDFGTSSSAYAHSYEYYKAKRHLNSEWPSGSRQTKEMTAILINAGESKSKKKVCFGEKAMDQFICLADDQVDSCYFFDRFKMALYSEEVSS